MPKGWCIQYIDRDPETICWQLELERKKKQGLDDEEKIAKFIEQQSMEFNSNISQVKFFGTKCIAGDRDGSVSEVESSQSSVQPKEKKKRKSALDEIMEMEEGKKRAARTDCWLQPEIMVKL
ncbi:DNA/RNA-binding protein KIN17 [Myotis davidii]|uniref:DNA/RNA-binding protein KIN17 n=1 Tax=Myotis davidii TaxID=225400 RepID=L5LDQ0_MYODS|nr:DNA/RNA-binding protein KIN17 [Myotis davidii]